MNLYLITRGKARRWYDTYDAHVIAAASPAEARKRAADVAAGEGPAVWATATVRKVGSYTGPRKRPHIVLSSFNAG